MKMLGKLAFCLVAAGSIAPAFAWDPPPPPHHDDRDHHDDHRDWHDDHHDDRYDHHDDHHGPGPGYAHHDWQRGHRYDGRVVVVDDWRTRRLREPPRGYHWVRDDDDGQFLLVAVATGIITDIVLQH
jgi:Predicted integral membrane protein